MQIRVPGKEPVPGIHKDLQLDNTQKTTKKRAKDLNRRSANKTHRWPTSTEEMLGITDHQGDADQTPAGRQHSHWEDHDRARGDRERGGRHAPARTERGWRERGAEQPLREHCPGPPRVTRADGATWRVHSLVNPQKSCVTNSQGATSQRGECWQRRGTQTPHAAGGRDHVRPLREGQRTARSRGHGIT